MRLPVVLPLLLSACGATGGGGGPFGEAFDLSAGTGADLGLAGCSPACAPPTPHCNDARRCVGCGKDGDCAAGMRCRVVSDAIATCTPGCSDDARCGPGRACCGGMCIDTTSDARHCGGCGKACTLPNGQATCQGGKCALGACNPGWGDCNKSPADGCEANLHTDPANCTACGTRCAIPNAQNACADGCYVTACQFGWDDCNRDDKDGCETSVVSDAGNCGGCGKKCGGLPNAKAACLNAACVLGACDPGWWNCDGDPKNGCEANLASDPKNCGACGKVCPMNAPACGNGACTNAFCHDIGYAKCPTGAKTWCTGSPIKATDAMQAALACKACYGKDCFFEDADCAGHAYGPQPKGAYKCDDAYFGYQMGCTGAPGRVWAICHSGDTYGKWAD